MKLCNKRRKNFFFVCEKICLCIFFLVALSSVFGGSLFHTSSTASVKFFRLASAELTHNVSYTVAGIPGQVGNTNGFPGTSLLTNPTALCSSPVDYSGGRPNQVLIGARNAFRTLNSTSWEAGYWFGKPSGDGIPTTGNISTVSLSNPYGCEVATSLNNILFFVQGDGNLYTVEKAGTLYSYVIDEKMSFVDVSYYDGKVYVVTLSQIVFQCDVSETDVQGCVQLQIEDVEENGAGQAGIAVSATGVFVATGEQLRWLSSSGGSIFSLDIPAVAVHFMVERAGVLIVATSTAVYTVEVETANVLKSTLIGGSSTSSTTCSTFTDYDKSTTFCGIYRIYPVEYDSIFISTPSLATVRLLSYPQVKIVISFEIPFADGMKNAEDVVSAVYDSLDKSVQTALSNMVPPLSPSVLPYIGVNQSDTTISPGNTSWITNISVLVPQLDFSGEDMEKAIREADYTDAVNITEAYYSKTDFIVFTDAILVDLANATTKFVVSNSTAFASRSALEYPLIYSDLPKQSNPSDTAKYANYTLFIKLLMPVVFGESTSNVANTTTGSLLSMINFGTVIINSMKKAYAPWQQGILSFQESTYHLSEYSDVDQQAIRLRLRETLGMRFKSCAKSVVGPNNLQTGVSNRTLVVASLNNGVAFSEYFVFAPDIYTDLDVQKCIDDTDWSGFLDWLKGLRQSSSTCGEGCAIAIAVVVAVIVILLIILLIVYVSKRRRLAVVLAPKLPQKPQFIPTVDLDNLDEDHINQNPLA